MLNLVNKRKSVTDILATLDNMVSELLTERNLLIEDKERASTERDAADARMDSAQMSIEQADRTAEKIAELTT